MAKNKINVEKKQLFVLFFQISVDFSSKNVIMCVLLFVKVTKGVGITNN